MTRPFILLLAAAPLAAGTLVVDTTADQFDTPSGPELSLREAIRDAGLAATTICFDASLSGETLVLTMGPVMVGGAGGGKITLDGSTVDVPVTLSGGGLDRVLAVASRACDINDIVISGSYVPNSPVGAVSISGDGAVILNRVKIRDNRGAGITVNALSSGPGTLADVRLNDCEFYNNHPLKDGTPGFPPDAALSISSGNQGKAVVRAERCSFYHNSVRPGKGVVHLIGGAGVQGPSSLVMINCTLAENAAPDGGAEPADFAGAIVVKEGGVLDLENSTVTANLGYGLIVESSTVDVRETILAGNRQSDGSLSNLSGMVNSLGANLSDEDLSAEFDAGFDRNEVDPQLSPLGYHGGEVLTCYPLDGSPAIDGGNPNRAGTSPSLDGRRSVRGTSNFIIQNGNPIDIGAVEVRTPEDLVVTSSADGGPGSLRQALADYAASGSSGRRITFDSSLSGATVSLLSALPWPASKHVDLDATGLKNGLTLTTRADDDILLLSGSAGMSLHGVRFANFKTTQTNANAGYNPIRLVDASSLGLHGVTLEENEGPFGGGIQSRSSGRIHMVSCQFRNNGSTQFSGNSLRQASVAEGMLAQVWKSSFVGNTSTSLAGGAIGFSGFDSRLEVRNCVFDQNTSSAAGSCLQLSGCEGTVSFSTFSRNTASAGAISLSNTSGGVDLSDCLFRENTSTSAGSPNHDLVVTPAASQGEITRCLTDNVDNSPGFFSGPTNEFAAVLAFGPLALYEGTVLSLPQLAGSEGIDTGDVDILRACDITGQVGTLEGVADAGAVEGALAGDALIEIIDVARTGNILFITFRALAGTSWDIESSGGLTGFAPAVTDIAATGNQQVAQVPLGNPAPDRLFCQFVPAN